MFEHMHTSRALVCIGLIAIPIIVIAPNALAICRIVNAPEDPPPEIKPDQSVLFLKRANLEVGDCESDGDAGPLSDAGPGDAGPLNAGTLDAGGDAGPGEPGGGIDPQPCQVIPEAITMVVQPKFRVGQNGSSFALLMVTPSQPVIGLERPELFVELAEVTAPIIEVERVTVEDSALGYQCRDPKYNSEPIGCGPSGPFGGGKSDFDPSDPPDWNDPDTDVVETIGPYEVARLSARDAEGLATGLTDLGYVYTQDDIDAISPYLDLEYAAVAVRVRVDAELSGGLQPLALTYPGTEMRLPLGISRQAELAETSIALYVSADARYEFAGAELLYAKLQSNLETVLTRSIMHAILDKGPEGDPIAERSSDNQPFQSVVTVTQEVRIPSSECPDEPDDDGLCCGCQQGSVKSAGNTIFLALSLALLGILSMRRGARRRRRR